MSPDPPSPGPRVAVICGSRSDLPALRGCFDALDAYEIGWEASVISAHRQPEVLRAYVVAATERGVQVFVGAAGLAAHLPGTLATLPARPVIRVPLAGVIPDSDWERIRSALGDGSVDVARAHEIERESQHDVLAFLRSVTERLGPEGRWLHYGLTSSDVLDTATAVTLRDATMVVEGELARLAEV